MTYACPAILFFLILTACGQSPLFGGFSDSEGYWLPLTVDLDLDTSVTEAGLEYIDACRQPQTLAIGDRVQESLTREIGKVFEHVSAGPAASRKRPADGAVRIALGLKEIELSISRQGTRTYPAKVTLGATVDYVDSTGMVLYTKNLKTDVRGEVETEGQQCDVQGLVALVTQTSSKLAQGLKQHLGTSAKIREAAETGKDPSRTASSSQRPPAMTNASAISSDSTQRASDEPASLSFRVMLKDDSQDDVLQSGESMSLEVEVSNVGTGVAKDVLLRLSGTALLSRQFMSPVAVGDVQPGETKRLTIPGTAPNPDALEQAELIIAIEGANTTDTSQQKRFQIVLQPNRPPPQPMETVDVDQIPERVPGFERPKAVGIAIGVGSFQNTAVPRVQFAARDAEVMAEYFRTVAGITQNRIRLATDEQVFKDDLADVFEAWLPEQVVSGSVIFIFLAGRALVNPSTGSVSLIPHEADPSSTRQLFSLRRLYDALARLPIQRALLMMDLTLTESSSNGAMNGKAPSWNAVPRALRGDKLVQIIGVKGRQEAHQYEEGRHGLFTYFLLKGLGGEADRDHNGTVAVGELCGYVHDQVVQAAKEKFDNAQEPACVPPAVSKSKTWRFPIGRLK